MGLGFLYHFDGARGVGEEGQAQAQGHYYSHRKLYEPNNEYKPPWASTEAWDQWVRAWKTEEFQASRSSGRRNRRRGDEAGVAEVTHAGGSVSARRTLRILEQEQQRTPLSYELFLRTHKVRTKDELQWVNEKSKAINDEYMRLSAELPVHAPDEEINDAYFQAIKNSESQEPTKKKPSKSVFGVGDATPVYYADVAAPQSQYQATPPPTQMVNERLDNLQESINRVEALLNSHISREEHDALMEEHRQLREAVINLLNFVRTIFVERQPPPPPPN